MIIVTNKRIIDLDIRDLKLQARAGQGKKITNKNEIIIEVKKEN